MITEKDLQEAIAECEGTRSPTSNTCIKLAAFYTILDHMKESKREKTVPLMFSHSAPEIEKQIEYTIDYVSDTDFSQSIIGKDALKVWSLMDELMTTLQNVNPRLYDGVIRKINSL